VKHPDPFTPKAAPVDRRLTAPGLAVTVAELVAVFVAHRPGNLAACGACHHRYTTAAPLCPSRALAAQLLKRRRHEDPDAANKVADELAAHDTRVLPPADPPAPPQTDGLFGLNPGWHKPKPTGRPSRPAA
jgi:hypothetical protein